MLKITLAFIKKEFWVEASYKASFLLNIFNVATTLLIYFFIDKLFGWRVVEHLKDFGVNYFSYVLVGMAFFSYIGVGVGSLSERLRHEQLQGTLEAIFLSPCPTFAILCGMLAWDFIFATLDMLIYLGCGIFLFKINFANLNLLSVAVTLILTIISFASLGIISASFIMVIKKGGIAGWMISQMQGLLGGVYFPVTVLPPLLQLAAKFFPITYAIRAIQLAVYRGFSLAELKNEITMLFLFSFLLLPISLALFRFALNRAKRQGSLSSY